MPKRVVFYLLTVLMVMAPSSGAEETAPTAEESAAQARTEAPFLLWGWWGPPVSKFEYQRYKEAHFNVISVPAGKQTEAAIRLAEPLELMAMIIRPQDVGGSAEDWVRFAAHFPNVLGWALAETVTPAEAPEIAEFTRKLRDLDKIRWPFVTLPPFAGDTGWGDITLTLLKAGIPALCLEEFAYFENGQSDDERFFLNLSTLQQLSAKTGAPFLGMAQVTKHGVYRQASESDIRAQAYSFLAHGARGIIYFTYWGPQPGTAGFESWGVPMVNPATRQSEYAYEMVRALNKELGVLGPRLMPLKCAAVFFAGPIPRAGKALPAEGWPIRRIEAESALVGFFPGEKGETWALLVNRRHGKQRSSFSLRSTMRLFPAAHVTYIAEIDRYSGAEKEIPADDPSFVITIPGGTGSLLRFKTAPSAGESPR